MVGWGWGMEWAIDEHELDRSGWVGFQCTDSARAPAQCVDVGSSGLIWGSMGQARRSMSVEKVRKRREGCVMWVAAE